mmetsp:Transcript_69180/g.165883  ORF Transcript_69180/g.165883 Transcript_69180/m.165883 type:complete len:293 (+) Transcript_69180:72-950(+)
MSWRYCVPSVLTLGSATSGLTAVRFAESDHFEASVWCVLCAAVLDGLDGHVARYLGGVTEIGAELDSLCDLVNFGVAPVLVIFFWIRALPKEACSLSVECKAEERMVWFACCFFLGCCAYRLARFNVAGRAAEMDRELPADEPQPESRLDETITHYWQVVVQNAMHRKLFFEGVPAPVGAAYALSPLMASLSGIRLPIPRIGAMSVLVLTGILMVSKVPTLSSKMLKSYRQASHLRSSTLATLVMKLLGVAMMLYFSWFHAPAVFLTLALLHVMTLPLGVVLFSFINDKKVE